VDLSKMSTYKLSRHFYLQKISLYFCSLLMTTYFLAVTYRGTNYAGFQIQENSLTIQGEIEKVLKIYLQKDIKLTGSSRTDAGVHALINYFHFTWDGILSDKMLYNLNAMCPLDISIRGIYKMHDDAHSRFDATSRVYSYYISTEKNPFLTDRSWFCPYPMNKDLLNAAAGILLGQHDFTSFAKKNSQVKTHICTIKLCIWEETEHGWKFTIEGNRFLRGMVRGLVATMAKVGRQKISLDEFKTVLDLKDNTMADFTAPAHGLFLESVNYPYPITFVVN